MKFPAYTSPQLRSTLPHPYLRPSAPGTSTALLPVKSSAPANTTRMSPSGNTSPESRRCNPGALAAPGNPNPAISEKSPPMAMYAPARMPAGGSCPPGVAFCPLPTSEPARVLPWVCLSVPCSGNRGRKGSETIRNAQADAVSLPGIFLRPSDRRKRGKTGRCPGNLPPGCDIYGLKVAQIGNKSYFCSLKDCNFKEIRC